MMTRIIIRTETEADYETITVVNDLAFGRGNEGKLVKALREIEGFEPRLSLVAELGGELIGQTDSKTIGQTDSKTIGQTDSKTIGQTDSKTIGHVLFTPITIQGVESDYPSLSLGPIAVIPDYQKDGIGGKLILEGHRIALELGYTSVILLGHPSYYPRFGYRTAELWGLTNPWGIHNEAFMVIELVEGSLEGKAGLVIYPEAFNQAT